MDAPCATPSVEIAFGDFVPGLASERAYEAHDTRKWVPLGVEGVQANSSMRSFPLKCVRHLAWNETLALPYSSIFNAAINASCGISTRPNWRIFFLPSFCFSSSFLLRVASPP